MKNEKFIGVDVGGTKMHFALIEKGLVIKESRVATDAYGSQEAVLKDLIDGVDGLFDETVAGVGVGVPGLVDPKLGIVRNVLNIPAWKNVPIKDVLENHFHVRVEVGNDANCFALGEQFFGKAKGYSDVVCLAMGTGLGAGVIVNDRLLIGNQCIAGEFGGISYKDADYETYCAGKFFSQLHDHDAAYYADLASKGDAEALDLFRQFGDHVGELIQTVMYSFGPKAILLGGSLTKSFAFFEQGMLDHLAKFPFQNVVESTLISVSDNAFIPVLGASSLVMSKD